MADEAGKTQKHDDKLGEDKLHNSEEFANYVHAVSIPMKVVMAAIVVFFAGVIAYCVFGQVPVTISAAAVADDTGVCTCYVKADDRDGLEPGNNVKVNGETLTIGNVPTSATCVDDSLDAYARQVGDLEIGDYVFLVTVDGSVPKGVYKATLTKEYLHPLAVLLAG